MSIRLTQPGAYADLGEVWLRDQLARLTQKRAQFGGHYRIEADAVLARSACTARAAAAVEVSTGDRFRRATVEAIEHCIRQESRVTHAVAAVFTH